LKSNLVGALLTLCGDGKATIWVWGLRCAKRIPARMRFKQCKLMIIKPSAAHFAVIDWKPEGFNQM
jgi:hypothetical protein